MKFLHFISRATAKQYGLKKYFSGKMCPKGHLSERFTSGWTCCECAEHFRDSEHKKKYDRQRYLANKETIDALARYRYAFEREKVQDQAKASYRRNRHKRLEKLRNASPGERAKKRANDKTWREANPDQVAAYKRHRKAAKKKRTVRWEIELTHFVSMEAGHLCKLREKRFGFKWEVDHIIPLLGKEVSGLHVWHNLEVIPASLNLRKNANFWYTEPLTWILFS